MAGASHGSAAGSGTGATGGGSSSRALPQPQSAPATVGPVVRAGPELVGTGSASSNPKSPNPAGAMAGARLAPSRLACTPPALAVGLRGMSFEKGLAAMERGLKGAAGAGAGEATGAAMTGASARTGAGFGGAAEGVAAGVRLVRKRELVPEAAGAGLFVDASKSSHALLNAEAEAQLAAGACCAFGSGAMGRYGCLGTAAGLVGAGEAWNATGGGGAAAVAGATSAGSVGNGCAAGAAGVLTFLAPRPPAFRTPAFGMAVGLGELLTTPKTGESEADAGKVAGGGWKAPPLAPAVATLATTGMAGCANGFGGSELQRTGGGCEMPLRYAAKGSEASATVTLEGPAPPPICSTDRPRAHASATSFSRSRLYC
mmetsp:Transcript_6980/g.22264  ORF Transcript_6980/g.22264 Transcript_6980/m.22264 type:complete len:372 (-) Transcript_6980:441-1556(-)